jgi:hypothetical protein
VRVCVLGGNQRSLVIDQMSSVCVSSRVSRYDVVRFIWGSLVRDIHYTVNAALPLGAGSPRDEWHWTPECQTRAGTGTALGTPVLLGFWH